MAQPGPFNLQAIRVGHNRFLQRQTRVLGAAIDEIADLAIKHARETDRVKWRTGAMSRGWTKTPLQLTALGMVLHFGSDVKHAFFQELGTGLWGPSHDYIYPKRAKVLRWVSNGQVHFARRVKGVPPKYIGKTSWFQAGFFEAKPLLNRHLGRLAKQF